MTGARIAVATCRDLPELDPDDAPLAAPLAARGVTLTPVVWDDPHVDWPRHDLTLIRSTWDYPQRREEFLTWARGVPRLANPAQVVAWNTDKRYLQELEAAGAPVVATTWLAPGEPWEVPDDGFWVIKPTVSVGSLDTGRYDLADSAHRSLARALIERLHHAGRHVMLQPYLPGVEEHGETALVYFGGRHSHAVRKGPMLDGPYEHVPSLYTGKYPPTSGVGR